MPSKQETVPTRRIYWDSCVFLSAIEGDDAERLPAIQAVMEDARDGRVEMWTSQLSITEVAFAKAEKDGKALEPEIEETIDALWAVDSPVKLVDVHESIVRNARGLIRHALKGGFVIKASDAIHLVTAQLAGCAELHTYDKKLFKFGSTLGLDICRPRVDQEIMFPAALSLLRGPSFSHRMWKEFHRSGPSKRKLDCLLNAPQTKRRSRNRRLKGMRS